MRLSLVACLILSFLILPSVGCQSFRQSVSAKSRQIFKRNKASDISSDELLDPMGARSGDRLLLDDLSPNQIATTFKARTRGVDQAAAQRYYERGQQAYDQGIAALEANDPANPHQPIFTGAANEFRLAAASWPDSAVEEDALYFQGEAYFFADRYVQSNRAFEKLIAQYSGTKHMDLAEQRRFAIAVYWLQLSESGSSNIAFGDTKRPKVGLAKEARRVLHRIRIDDPTGKLADDATLTLGKAYMKSKQYYEASDTLEDLRKNYPGSKYQFDAHMLELEARLNAYQGKSYDDTPLRKAEQIVKAIVEQFPKQAQENLDYLEKQNRKIKNMVAERDLGLGEYFENRGENLAAKFHYEKVANQFEGSEIASQVRERIADVASKPARPGQHAKWFVDLFPNPEKAKPLIASGDNESIFR